MLNLILTIALIGVLLWALTTYVPMPEPIRGVLIAIGVIAIIVIAARYLGVAGL